MSKFDRNALWLHFYLVFIDFIGLSKDLAVLNCKVLKEKSPYAVSGVYWIDPDGGSRSNAFQVYCDQQTDGGGWTLKMGSWDINAWRFESCKCLEKGCNLHAL